ncbi:sigma-70 family RNA polymerase sigma factor [Myxococcus sp. K38C18041901]|uniref:sigma-70 family RNA polymerase sigma factor n=1 Tax=Myxococcus guangdongensis TaxID=2906760 RepID=UPI0020A6EFD6|nr:sigma-70 family RNA polymerase sigma factor [Myxococcus guangdongensis]MCP3064884.1 sigma-70 family RNA polymerase sigma factor [Myxococcus guangdongensis]
MSLPTPTEEQELHQRVLKGESLAPKDVFTVFVDPITARLCRDPRQSKEQAWDAVIDVIYAYLAHPERYIPERSRLSTYLSEAAKKKLFDGYRSREARTRREREFGTVFELCARAPKESLEVTVEARLAVRRIDHARLPERDRVFIGLVLQGEGSTHVLARAMGLPPMPDKDRKREVKRNRDRLVKWLRRFGKEDRDDES